MPRISNIAKFILYADDANIIVTGNSIAEIEEQLSDLTVALSKWVNVNGLKLNLKKTNYMIFSRRKLGHNLKAQKFNVHLRHDFWEFLLMINLIGHTILRH